MWGKRASQCTRRQTVCKPGSVPPESGDGHSSGTFVTERLMRPTRAAARKARPAASLLATACRSYLVLLPVGFALPPPLPAARCALTAPFHPCRGKCYAPRRFVLCGTFPGVLPLARKCPAGRYPAPRVHGARTFLPGDLSVVAGTAVQPTDPADMEPAT